MPQVTKKLPQQLSTCACNNEPSKRGKPRFRGWGSSVLPRFAVYTSAQITIRRQDAYVERACVEESREKGSEKRKVFRRFAVQRSNMRIAYPLLFVWSLVEVHCQMSPLWARLWPTIPMWTSVLWGAVILTVFSVTLT